MEGKSARSQCSSCKTFTRSFGQSFKKKEDLLKNYNGSEELLKLQPQI